MSQVSRNSPCPCGSGQRYKSCCGALTSVNIEAQTQIHPMYPGWARLEPTERASLWGKMLAALDAQKSGNADYAKSLYEAVLERAPHTFDALHMLGVIEMEFGNLDRAEALMTEATKWMSTPEAQRNLALLRYRKRNQEGIYSVRSTAAADAIALFAAATPALDSTGERDCRLLRRHPAQEQLLHILAPGDLSSVGSNRTACRLRDRFVKDGYSVALWRNPSQADSGSNLEGARDTDPGSDQVPRGGILAIAGLDSPMISWLPRHAGTFEEIYVLLDAQVPPALATLLGRLPPDVLTRLRIVARTECVLSQLGLRGIVDPFLLGGESAVPADRAGAGARVRLGVFIMPLGGARDRERWRTLEWLRSQDLFIRILYPGALPSRHIPNDEEHLISLATEWNNDWCADLHGLFFWGAEGRAHQFDSLVVEARVAGLRVIVDGYAETAGSDATDQVFFGADDARTAFNRSMRGLRELAAITGGTEP